ncbi:MAG: multidrug effflux MFS transporter [Shimia sp.]
MSIATATLSTPERASLRFVALMSFLTACVALAIDLMLSSIPAIGMELSPEAPAAAQLVMAAFVVALGAGTFLAGPLADAVGRRPLVLWGLALYALGAAIAAFAPSLWVLLAGRALMGLGASAPRVAVLAIIRDRFEGRAMARTASLVMMIFTLVPGVAPLLGAWIEAVAGWRAVFAVFVLFGSVGIAWFGWQQPETLRTPRLLVLRRWMSEVAEVLRHPQVRKATAVQMLVFAPLYALLTGGPIIFTEVFGIGALFPILFCIASLSNFPSALANARLVERLGMVRLIRGALTIYVAICLGTLATFVALPSVWTYFALMFTGFFMLGFTIGNSNALALQPLGHIAGTGAATVTSIATLGAGLVSVPIALAYDGTAWPMMLGTSACVAVALAIAWRLERD